MASIDKAVQHFADIWRELLLDLPDNYSCTMTCTEAEAAAGLYRSLGDNSTADQIIKAHAEYDGPGDQHATA